MSGCIPTRLLDACDLAGDELFIGMEREHSHQNGNSKKKIQEIVIPGGAFPDGHRIIKEGQKQVNYFSSPQRLNKLEEDHAAIDLPAIWLHRKLSRYQGSIHCYSFSLLAVYVTTFFLISTL